MGPTVLSEFRLVYDFEGTRGAVYISAPTSDGARRVFLERFSSAVVVRCCEVRA